MAGECSASCAVQSWLLSLYLDCPAGIGFHCPSKFLKEVSVLLQLACLWLAGGPSKVALAEADRDYRISTPVEIGQPVSM